MHGPPLRKKEQLLPILKRIDALCRPFRTEGIPENMIHTQVMLVAPTLHPDNVVSLLEFRQIENALNHLKSCVSEAGPALPYIYHEYLNDMNVARLLEDLEYPLQIDQNFSEKQKKDSRGVLFASTEFNNATGIASKLTPEERERARDNRKLTAENIIELQELIITAHQILKAEPETPFFQRLMLKRTEEPSALTI